MAHPPTYYDSPRCDIMLLFPASERQCTSLHLHIASVAARKTPSALRAWLLGCFYWWVAHF